MTLVARIQCAAEAHACQSCKKQFRRARRVHLQPSRFPFVSRGAAVQVADFIAIRVHGLHASLKSELAQHRKSGKVQPFVMTAVQSFCNDSPGGSLFLAICRGCSPPLASDPETMTEAWQLAGQHGLEPLVAGYILDHPEAGWPTALQNEARKTRDFALVRNIQLLALLGDIGRTLDGAGIPWIALKGPVFTAQYVGDLSRRTSSDLDVLVHPGDVPQVDRLFRSMQITSRRPAQPQKHPLGIRGHEHKYYSTAPRYLVELHWDLVWRSCYEIVSPGALFQRAGTFQTESGSFPVLSPEDAILYAAVHAFEHCWDHFHQLKTLDWILMGRPGWGQESLDWNFMLKTAAQAGKSRIFLLGLKLTRDLLHRQLPALVDDRIDSDPVLASLASQVGRNFHGAGPARSLPRAVLFKWQAMETWSDRLSMAFATVAARLGWLRPPN